MVATWLTDGKATISRCFSYNAYLHCTALPRAVVDHHQGVFENNSSDLQAGDKVGILTNDWSLLTKHFPLATQKYRLMIVIFFHNPSACNSATVRGKMARLRLNSQKIWSANPLNVKQIWPMYHVDKPRPLKSIFLGYSEQGGRSWQAFGKVKMLQLYGEDSS